MTDLLLPSALQKQMAGQHFEQNKLGFSSAQIWISRDLVLKIQPEGEVAENEVRAMEFLQGRFPAPSIRYHACFAGQSYLLMTRLPGKEASCPEQMGDPKRLVQNLADALRRLWAIDVSDCPLPCMTELKIGAARKAVETENRALFLSDPEIYGFDPPKDTSELLSFLEENRPREKQLLSHGDFCLPNVFFDQKALTGIADLGRMGLADPWQDIALCYRSLIWNFRGEYGRAYPGFSPEMFFDALGIEPDLAKLRYYLLLDEIF